MLRSMPKRAKPLSSQSHEPDWFLRQWMATLRMKQSQLAELTGWGKAKTNDIYHGRTGYYRQIVNDAARALQLQPYELLLPPSEARAIQSMVRAVHVVEASEVLSAAANAEDPAQDPTRKASV